MLPWGLLVVGSVASLAANVTVAEPTVTGRVIAAWPSFALIGAYELLMRQVRRGAMAGSGSREQCSKLPQDTQGTSTPQGSPVSDRALQRQAWQWAQAHRAENGSLPTGREIARQYGRHERWGRLVKHSGCLGELAARHEPQLRLVGPKADSG